ncbi:MAG: TRAP transporter substrate-binding protein, partial [Phaeodactylibacter sp.]|nr:TRAP transporter substrate-binding protein [Phaeodactylibacter sp.]
MKISRKNFFKGIAFGTISLPFLIRAFGGKNHAQEDAGGSPNVITARQYRWKMVTTWPPNFPILGEACNKYAELVEKMSGGRIRIRVYGGNELVPALEAFDTVRTGGAEIGSGAAYYWAGKAPAAQFFASVPFGMNAQQLNAWIIGGGGMELWEELYRDFNLVPMAGGNTGVQMGGWFNKEINSVSDFKGLKMRIPGLGGDVLTKLGASPVSLPGGQIYENLVSGAVDATEWVGPYNDYFMKFYEAAKFYYYPGMHEPGSQLSFGMNKSWWSKLSKTDQAIIEAACNEENSRQMAETNANNGIYLTKMIKDHGVTLKEFNEEIYDAFGAASQEVFEETRQHSALAAKIHDSFAKARNDLGRWSGLA